MWRRADDDLWVATVDGEYGGMVTRLPDGFHVHDRYSRPIGVASSFAAATRLQAPSRSGAARSHRARPHHVRARLGATTGPVFAGPSHQREKTA
ncbi:hypothetical protein LEP48_00980 [Isoptericola sp. NEAU-Y5]|uniref:Uncharacterized protein n=1 Tax=Isoptericola luteus TaxID=2879484 RepID=A0ABS7ZA42_9MICO|nr:hypothetical protein [Isoptericola sp. NEAU-Y5]MCA5891923.1 hypothetical protein [Isoptericola sp. NEAU-Y5]